MPQRLDYQRQTRSRRLPRAAATAIGTGIGAAVTLPALFLAILSIGAGHGDYFFARAFFPIPMCIAAFVMQSITTSCIVIGVTQFPLYGAAIGYASATNRKVLTIITSSIVIVHLVAFTLCSQSSAFG